MPGCLPDVVSDQDCPTRTPGCITPRLRPRTRTHTRPLSRKHLLRKAYVNAKLTDSLRLETEYPPSGERRNASHQTHGRLRLGSPAKGATRTWGTAGDIAQRYQDGMVLHPLSHRYNTSLRLPVYRLTFAATSGPQRRLAHQALGHSQTTELSKLVLIPCLRHEHWSRLPSDHAAGNIHHSPVLGILSEYNTPGHHHPLS